MRNDFIDNLPQESVSKGLSKENKKNIKFLFILYCTALHINVNTSFKLSALCKCLKVCSSFGSDPSSLLEGTTRIGLLLAPAEDFDLGLIFFLFFFNPKDVKRKQMPKLFQIYFFSNHKIKNKYL